MPRHAFGRKMDSTGWSLVDRPAKWLAAAASSLLVVASVALGGTIALAPASAAPGSPGTPQAGTTVFAEGFENVGPVATGIQNYVGGASANNAAYTADPYWQAGTTCNGWVMNSVTPRPASDPCMASISGGGPVFANTVWTNMGYMAQALGQLQGQTPAASVNNHALSEYTGGSGSPGVQLQTKTQPVPMIPGHFYVVSADYAVMSYTTGGAGCNLSDPSLTFSLISGATRIPIGTNLDPCTAPGNKTITVNNVPIRVASLVSGAIRWTGGTTAGIQLYNANGSGGGNDSAFDNARVLDVTPQLDKSFAPAVAPTGGTSTLTFTVTNTTELAAKSGWSFTDALPAGLTVASPSTAATTCPSGVVTAPAGATSIAVTGDLSAGQTSCTVSINVTSPTPATFTNGPSNVTTSLNPPGSTTVTFQKPALTVVKHAGTPVDVNGDGLTDAGDTIQYTFDVTNSGDVPITGIAVNDPKVGAVTCPSTTLAPQATQLCAADAVYTVTSADVTAGSVANTATATGTDPLGGAITSPPSSTNTPAVAAAPALTVVKSASPSDAASFQAGQVVTYTFVVTNTGNVPLTGVAVDDSDFSGTGTLSALDCPAGADTLAVGEQVTCSATYTLTQADVDAGSVSNSATASGVPPATNVPIQSPPSSVTIPVPAAPAISLVKSASPASANKAGDTITYSFRVTNTGNVTVTDPSITETAFSGTGATPAATCPAGSVLPGQFVTCTASYALTQADVDAGSVTNTATAAATPPTGAAVTSGTSSAAVSIAPAPALTIVKSATPATVAAAGDTVTYSFQITNTGNVTLAGVAVTEGAFTGTGTLAPAVCPAGAASLAPGDSVTCTTAYTVTQADVDAGSVTNTATATGTPPAGGTPPVSPPSTAIVAVDAAPAIALVKSATPATIAAAGDLVSYTFLVTNTGPVTLTDPSITETAFSGSGPIPVAVCPTGPVAPGASVTCTANYTVTQADVDAGGVTNTATATASVPAGYQPPVSASSSATVAAASTPALTLVKTSSTTLITQAGQVVDYAFLVTNTGNVTVKGIAIAEGGFTGTGTIPAAVCPQPNLAPGTSETCTAAYTVTQADLDAGGTLSNSATATGTLPGSSVAVSSPTSTAIVPIQQTAGLSLVKSASPMSPDSFRAGEDISYVFVVTNTGTVTIHDVVIQEGSFTGTGTLPAPDCPPGPLAPGDQLVCTTHYTVTQADVDAGSITNSATATGTPPGNLQPPVSPPSDVTVPTPPAPAVTMVKTADAKTITHAGQKITYTFTVTNTGNVTLTEPTVTEGRFTGHGTLSAPECPAVPSGLAPGQVIECHATYTVVAADLTGDPVTNTATVTVTGPDGDPLTSDPSTATVAEDLPAAAATPLADTGSTIGWGVGGLAAVLLAVGGALLFFRRRGRTHDE